MNLYCPPSTSQFPFNLSFGSLPPELKQEIFLFSVSPIPRHHPHASDDPDTFPDFEPAAINISHTCSEWRAIVQATPGVWSWMIIYNPTQRSVQFVEHCLLYAGQSPLNLVFQSALLTSNPDMKAETCTQTIINLWLAQAPRWGSIEFEFDHPFETNLLFDLDPRSLLQLKQANLSFDSSLEECFPELWERIDAAPSLEELRIRGNGEIPLADQVQAPFFCRLTNIFICPAVIIKDFLSFLSSCKQVQSLGLLIQMEQELEQNLSKTTQIIEMPFLRALSLWGWPINIAIDGGHLLDRIFAPQLRSLQVLPPSKEQASVEALLRRSRCHLQALQLDTYTAGCENALLKCLELASPHLGKLESVTLTNDGTPSIPFSDAVLSPFTPTSSNGRVVVPFPSLLKLSIDPATGGLEDTLRDLCRLRSLHGFPLPYLEVHALTDDASAFAGKSSLVSTEGTAGNTNPTCLGS